MADPINWELRLINEISGSAKLAARDLRDLGDAAKGVSGLLGALTGVEKAESKAAEESKEKHEGFFADMFKADVLAEKFDQLTDKVFEFGAELIKSAVEATDFDYKTKVALTHMTGSAEEAEDIMAHARAFAQGTGEDLDKAMVVFQRLAATDLRGSQLTAAADAAKDLAAVSGRSFDQTADLFEMIGSDKGLGGKAVRQLVQFPALLKEMEKHFGFVPGTQRSFEQFAHHLTEAPIKGAAGLALLENMIAKVAHEKELGTVGVELGQSFEGSFTKIKNDWKMILGDMAESPLFAGLRSSLGEIATYFDPIKGHGKEVEKILAELGNELLTAIKPVLEHPEMLKQFFEGAVGAGKAVVEIFEFLSPIARAVAGFVVDVAHEAGVVAKILGATPGSGGPETGISRIPHFADEGRVTGPTIAMIGEGSEPESVLKDSTVRNMMTTGSSTNVHINVTVDGTSHRMDEQGLAALLEETLPGKLISVLEHMNQQGGG